MRSFLAALYLLPATLLAWLLTWSVWPFSPRGHAGFHVMRWWARLFLPTTGYRLRHDGLERISGGPYLIVANHASMLDIIMCAAAIPVPFRFVSRPFFFAVPFMGWAMWSVRNLSLDPKRPREGARVLRTLESWFAEGVSILLYPEGTRSPDGSVREYKRGPFLTAIRDGIPILPLCLAGASLALPKKSLRLHRARLTAAFGEPIPTKDLNPPDARDLARRVESWTKETKNRLEHSI